MISLYKPNPSNSGCAFSFKIGIDQKSQEPALYMSAIQQHSWDSQKKTGSFSGSKNDPEKNINIKLNEFECGEIISSFTHRSEYSTFHSFGENNTSIKFVPWDKKKKSFGSDKEETVRAFGINVTRNKNVFKVPLEPGEVEVLIRFIIKFLDIIIQFRIDSQTKIRKNKKTNSSNSNNIEAVPF